MKVQTNVYEQGQDVFCMAFVIVLGENFEYSADYKDGFVSQLQFT